jgi:hypothetical protein
MSRLGEVVRSASAVGREGASRLISSTCVVVQQAIVQAKGDGRLEAGEDVVLGRLSVDEGVNEVVADVDRSAQRRRVHLLHINLFFSSSLNHFCTNAQLQLRKLAIRRWSLGSPHLYHNPGHNSHSGLRRSRIDSSTITIPRLLYFQPVNGALESYDYFSCPRLY